MELEEGNLSTHSNLGETDDMSPYAAVNKVTIDESHESAYSNIQRTKGEGNGCCRAIYSGREIQLTRGSAKMSEYRGAEESTSHSSTRNQILTLTML